MTTLTNNMLSVRRTTKTERESHTGYNDPALGKAARWCVEYAACDHVYTEALTPETLAVLVDRTTKLLADLKELQNNL